MAKIIETIELEVCTDCVLLIANGEGDPELAAKIADRWEGYQLVPGDGSEAFSWSPCEGCGSTLGGDRHGAAALREITVAERLEELRAEIRAERISYGELSELQELASHIDRSDVELLEWAGVPEAEVTSR